jgi:hypothetical protein
LLADFKRLGSLPSAHKRGYQLEMLISSSKRVPRSRFPRDPVRIALMTSCTDVVVATALRFLSLPEAREDARREDLKYPRTLMPPGEGTHG